MMRSTMGIGVWVLAACGGGATPAVQAPSSGGDEPAAVAVAPGCADREALLGAAQAKQAQAGFDEPCVASEGIVELDGDATPEWEVACPAGTGEFRFVVYAGAAERCGVALGEFEGMSWAPVDGATGAFPQIEAPNRGGESTNVYTYDPATGAYAYWRTLE